mgnify:CR=1 FL=1
MMGKGFYNELFLMETLTLRTYLLIILISLLFLITTVLFYE